MLFCKLKNKKIKNSLSNVQTIDKMSEIRNTVNRKFGPGRPRASIIKGDHTLKMTVLKSKRKRLLSTANRSFPSLLTKSRRVKETGFYENIWKKKSSVVKKFYLRSFKTVISTLWSHLRSCRTTRTNFLFNVPIISYIFPFLRIPERNVIPYVFSKLKKSTWLSYFPVLILQTSFSILRQGIVLHF